MKSSTSQQRRNKVASVRRRRASSSHQSGGYQSLEPRLALTTFIVNTLLDDGGLVNDGRVSLREAVTAASTNATFGDAAAGDAAGDSIIFDASLAGQTITLTMGELVILDDVGFRGGTNDITIDAGSASRHFSIVTSERVSFGKLSFTNGSAGRGGSISSTGGGNVIVFDSDFTGNSASGDGGGAIFNETGNVFISGGSVFDGNLAEGASGSGGAILSTSGNIQVLGGEFYSNVAARAGGAVEVVDGGFASFNSIFGAANRGNLAGRTGAGAPGNGGALHVTGTANVSITGGRVEANVAQSEGGGLWNQAGANMVVRGGAVVSDNLALGAAADEGGGGIFNNGGRLVVNGATVSYNSTTGASSSGGGIFSTDGRVIVINSMITGNETVRAGGGVEIIDGLISFSDSMVQNNGAGRAIAAPGNGGGLHVSGTATTIVLNSEFSTNFAASEGGGLWNQVGAAMYITGSQITGNAAAGSNADNGGGGIFNNGGRVFVATSDIDANRAVVGSGSGGGIFSTSGVVAVRNSKITNNFAARAGGGVELIDGQFRALNGEMRGNQAGVAFNASPGNGGALHVTGGSAIVNLDAVAVIANRAANQGGGLWNQTGSLLLVRNGTRIVDNVAFGTNAVGGGVYNKGYFQSLDNVIFRNRASAMGGGVFVTSTGQSRIENTRFSTNNGGAEGGGMWNDGRLSMRDVLFASNTATSDGGGIFNTSLVGVQSVNVRFANNTPNDQNA